MVVVGEKGKGPFFGALDRARLMRVFFLYVGLALQLGSLMAQDDLVRVATLGSRSAKESIRSIRARYQISVYSLTEKSNPIVSKQTVSYWESGGNAKIISELVSAEEWSDRSSIKWSAVSVDGIRTSLTTRQAKEAEVNNAIIRNDNDDEAIAGDFWPSALFALVTRPRRDLVDFLAGAKTVAEMQRDKQGAVYRLLVSDHPDFTQTEFTIDVRPEWNFLVTYFKTKGSSEQETIRYEKRVLSVLEPVHGIFFPRVVESVASVVDHKSSKVVPYRKSVTEFRDVEINGTLDKSTFQLNLPAGTAVNDHRMGTSYLVGKDGSPENVEPTVPQSTAKPVVPTYISDDLPSYKLVYVAIGLGAIILCGLVYKMRRSK